MNKVEFVNEYRSRIIELSAFSADELDSMDEDDHFSAPNLEKFLDEKEGMLLALTDFRMSGKSLAEIVDAIGGAEMYGIDEVPLLEDIRSLRILMMLDHGTAPMGDRIENAEIAVEVVRRWMKDRGIDEVEADRFAHFWDEKGIPAHSISVDIALGGIIHARQIAILRDYNHKLPGGDDTYFDYYPGDMFYCMAVMNWFLNDGPRVS